MDADQLALAKQIWRAIADLFFSAENQDKFIGAADELGLTPPMLKALLELEPGEGKAMRSLADDWGCDASFVTVIVDGLEQQGYADRRVAEHDRRVKTVELTHEGVAAREWALDAVYGARSGFWDLTPDERVALAGLLRKLADAQDVHDQRLLASGRARGFMGRHPGHKGPRTRRAAGGRRWGPGGHEGEAGESWRDHLAAHREELRHLRDELFRVRDEVRAVVRAPVDDVVDDVRSAKDEAKASARSPIDEVKEFKDEVEAVTAEVKAQLKGRRAPPG